MTIRCIYLLNRERIGRIDGRDHAELLAALRVLHISLIEALTL